MKKEKKKNEVVVFGNGEMASLAHFYFQHDSDLEVVAFTVDREYKKEDKFEGIQVVDFEEVAEKFPPDKYYMFVPISFTKMNHLRREKFEAVKELGYTCTNYVSSKATTWPDLNIGENNFIFEDNTIQPFVEIGDNCVLWSGNHIGHHSVIGDHVFITSHVVISGHCEIKDHAMLGVNATIREQTIIEEATLVGMGANIIKDTEAETIHLGAKSTLYHKKSRDLDKILHKD